MQVVDGPRATTCGFDETGSPCAWLARLVAARPKGRYADNARRPPAPPSPGARPLVAYPVREEEGTRAVPVPSRAHPPGARDPSGRLSDRATGAVSIPGLPGRLSGERGRADPGDPDEAAVAPGTGGGGAEGPLRAIRAWPSADRQGSPARPGKPGGSMQRGAASRGEVIVARAESLTRRSRLT